MREPIERFERRVFERGMFENGKELQTNTQT